MQKILTEGDLLNASGGLCEAGYAMALIKRYDRSAIKANRFRIKEWDYYLIHNEDFGVALTLADNGYMGLVSASFLNFAKPHERTVSKMFWFPMGKTALPPTSAQGSSQKNLKGCSCSFTHEGGRRRLTLSMDNFAGGKPFSCELWLFGEPEDSMVIATPFKEAPRAFYYNQKIVGMRAEGWAEYLGERYEFQGTDSFGLLDWGRGVWTYSNTWYWGAAQGEVDGHSIGFNIGYGFGDTSAASENMVFFDGMAHKLKEIDFGIPRANGRDDYMSVWHMTSSDGRFSMDFEPLLDRFSDTNALLIRSCQHQVFGRFSGRLILDDGREVEVKNLLGFAEKVKNRW
ncbi:MAG: DUF2804 domain-containing protein [Clostridia bacterium]|nr:DUF2804 domain-containing protein [Clostridia bacterium]